MAKKKPVSSKSVEQEEFIPESIVEQEEFNPEPIVEQEEVAPEVVEQDEVAAVKTVAKKKGLSSFGSMLKAASAKRKERNLKFKNDGENES